MSIKNYHFYKKFLYPVIMSSRCFSIFSVINSNEENFLSYRLTIILHDDNFLYIVPNCHLRLKRLSPTSLPVYFTTSEALSNEIRHHLANMKVHVCCDKEIDKNMNRCKDYLILEKNITCAKNVLSVQRQLSGKVLKPH